MGLSGSSPALTLLPLSHAEILGRPPSFLSLAFQGQVAPVGGAVVGDDLIEIVLAGGYLEALARPSGPRNFFSVNFTKRLASEAAELPFQVDVHLARHPLFVAFGEQGGHEA